MLNALLWNLLLTAVLAMALAALCRLPSLARRPALRHWLWLLVLVKLVTPPLVAVPLLPAVVEPRRCGRDCGSVQPADGASRVGFGPAAHP